MIVGSLLLIVVQYPESLRAPGSRDAVTVFGLLVVYAGIAAWVRRSPAGALCRALAKGARVGAVLVVVEVLNLALEHSSASATLSAVRGVSSWAAIFLAFGAAGALGASVSEDGTPTAFGPSVGRATLSSIWCGLIAAVGAVLAGVMLPVFFMPRMIQILAPAAAGAADLPVFVVRNTMSAAGEHLLVLPIVAAVFGTIGGSAALLMHQVPRRVALFIGALQCVLAVGGIAALRWASLLPRSARPLYVRCGLLALGLTLACALPMIRAIRGKR